MKKITKKILGIILSGAMICSSPMGVQAQENANMDLQIEEVVNQFKEDFPNADIQVIDGTVHVVLQEENDVPQSRMTSVTSSRGGSFVDFNIPWYEVYQPYCQVYMNKTAVEAAKVQKEKPEIVQYILYEWAAGVTAGVIVAQVEQKYGVRLDQDAVEYLVSNAFKFVGEFDRNSLINAQNASSSGKAYVVYGNYSNGVPFTVYGPWNGNTCTTYMGMNALTWKDGVYYNIYASL